MANPESLDQWKMSYEELPYKSKKPLTRKQKHGTIPTAINKIKKDKKMTNITKTKHINDMTTLSILWFLIRRHDKLLLILALVLSWVFFIITRTPTAVHNFIR